MAQYNNIIISVGVIGLIQLLLSIAFWFLHLNKNKEHPIYRIRHPLLWQTTICILSFAVIWKSIITYFFTNSYIHRDIYTTLEVFRIIVLSFGFSFVRVCVLWYSLKLQRYEQNTLILQHLLNEDNISQNGANQSIFEPIPKLIKQQKTIKVPCLYRHSKYFRPIKIVIVVESILCIFWIISASLAMTVHSWPLIKLVAAIVILLLFLFLTFLILSIWCKCCDSNKRQTFKLKPNYNKNDKNDDENDDEFDEEVYGGSIFRDDFKFRWELTAAFIVFIITLPYQLWVINKYPLEGDQWEYGLMMASIGVSVTMIPAVWLQILIPYYTLCENTKKFKDPTAVKRHKSEQSTGGTSSYYVVSLLDILTHQYGFFLFIDQLVQEVSLENLSYLIEIYQFKHTENNETKSIFRKHLKRKKKKMRKKFSRKYKKTDIQSNEKINDKTEDNKELKLMNYPSNNSINNELDVPTLDNTTNASNSNSYISELSQPSDNNVTMIPMSGINNNMEISHDSLSSDSHDSIYSEYSRRKGTVDIAYFNRILEKMPWHGIPATNSNNMDKFEFAINIFNKYIDRNSFYCVNISSEAWDLIDGLMQRLKVYKMKNDTLYKKKKNDDENEREITPLPQSSDIEAQIKSLSSNNDVKYMNDYDDELNVEAKLKEADNINTMQQFNHILMCIFDASLPDVFHNLEDSMMRFRITDEFLSLTGKR